MAQNTVVGSVSACHFYTKLSYWEYHTGYTTRTAKNEEPKD